MNQQRLWSAALQRPPLQDPVHAWDMQEVRRNVDARHSLHFNARARPGIVYPKLLGTQEYPAGQHSLTCAGILKQDNNDMILSDEIVHEKESELQYLRILPSLRCSTRLLPTTARHFPWAVQSSGKSNLHCAECSLRCTTSDRTHLKPNRCRSRCAMAPRRLCA